MKRGLVVLDPEEIPADELAQRNRRLQQALQRQGMGAALLYGDVHRSGDLAYLSNICIYWNEGVLAVPSEGEPALLTKLSSRVHPWMRSISNLHDLRSGPNLAELGSAFLASASPPVLGLVEMDWWPGVLVDELAAKLPGWELRDLGPVIRDERRRPSSSERKLLRASARIAADAAASGLTGGGTHAQRAGRAELAARTAGVEDVFVACHPAGDGADTLEVLAQYRGYWTVAARTSFERMSALSARMRSAYDAAAHMLRSGSTVEDVHHAAAGAFGEWAGRWRIDVVHHTDLETGGDYRAGGESSAPIAAPSVVGLRLECALDGNAPAVLADTFEIEETSAACLTGAQAFAGSAIG